MVASLQVLTVTPTQFEAACGRATAKKWKSSVRYAGAGKHHRMEIGKYLKEVLQVR